MVSKDVEQDLVLASASYWRLFLQPKLDKLICREFLRNRRVRSDDTKCCRFSDGLFGARPDQAI